MKRIIGRIPKAARRILRGAIRQGRAKHVHVSLNAYRTDCNGDFGTTCHPDYRRVRALPGSRSGSTVSD